MNPLLLGSVGLGALWLLKRGGASSGGTPGTTPQASPSAPALAANAQMLFRDYQWTVLVPSLKDVSAYLSPPPGATIGSGKWWKYPGGMATGPFGPLRGGHPAPVGASRGHAKAASTSPPHAASRPAGAPTSPPAGGTVGVSTRKIVLVAAWGGVPPSSAIYAWRPTTGTSQALNGYLVYGTGAWYVDLAPAAGSTDSDALVTGAGSTWTGFNLYVEGKDLPPAPTPALGTPAATVVSNAGAKASWQLKHPGLLVWIGASNANEADLEALSAPVTMSTPAPAVPQVPAAGAQTALPLPLKPTTTLSQPSSLPRPAGAK